MDAGLFDVLVGHFADGRRLDDVPDGEHAVASIISNLSHLLNARRGTIPHVPTYGLPDISEVYRDMPDSIDDLQRSILEAVKTYEPRLRRVRVTYQETDGVGMRLVFVLSGELSNRQRISFETVFSSHEQVDVQPLRRPR